MLLVLQEKTPKEYSQIRIRVNNSRTWKTWKQWMVNYGTYEEGLLALLDRANGKKGEKNPGFVY